MVYVQQQITALTYTNAPSIADEYSPTANYVTNDLSRYNERIYKSITGVAPNYNVGNNPVLTENINWFNYAPSNAYAILDLYNDTVTEWTADGIIEFDRGSKDTIGIGNFKATQITIEYLDALSGVVSGLTIATSIDLNSTITAGLVYVNLKRFDIVDTAKLFTASKDTYVDINLTGTIIYTEVANGDPAPTLITDYQRIAKVITDATSITSVTDLRIIIDPVLYTETYNFLTYMCKVNFWKYIYCGFSEINTKVVYQSLKRLGKTIRVTFSAGGANTSCGFCIAGIATDTGKTVDEVSFPDRRIGSSTINVADFNTIVDKKDLITTVYLAKRLVNIPMMFVVDTINTSVFDNMVFLATILKCDAIASNQDKNQISWELQQNIIL